MGGVLTLRPLLGLKDRTRDLTMFNLAIEGRLRGCDVVAIKVGDARRADTLRPRNRAVEEDRSIGQI
jgi:hypothetical protein